MPYPEALRRYWQARDSNVPLDADFFRTLDRELFTEMRSNIFRLRPTLGSSIFPSNPALIRPDSRADPAHYNGDTRTIRGLLPHENSPYNIIRDGQLVPYPMDPHLSRLSTGIHETFHHYSMEETLRFRQTIADRPRDVATGQPIREGYTATIFGNVRNDLLGVLHEADLSTVHHPRVGFRRLVSESMADLAAHLWMRSNFRRNGATDPAMQQHLQSHMQARFLRRQDPLHDSSMLLRVAETMDREGRIPPLMGLEQANAMAREIMGQNINNLLMQYVAARSSTAIASAPLQIPPNSPLQREIALARLQAEARYATARHSLGEYRSSHEVRNSDITAFANPVLERAQQLGINIPTIDGAHATTLNDGRIIINMGTASLSHSIRIERDARGRFSGTIMETPATGRPITRPITPQHAAQLYEALPPEVRDAIRHPSAAETPTRDVPANNDRRHATPAARPRL